MIKLKIDDYCENCDEFEPEVEKDKMHLSDRPVDFNQSYWEFGSQFKYFTTITCKHRERCKSIADYIKKNIEKEKSENND